MATQDLNRDLNGLNPLAYLGVNPTTPPQLVTENRAPTSNDYVRFPVGTLWLVSNTNDVYILTNKSGNVATWTFLTGTSSVVDTGDILAGTAPNTVGVIPGTTALAGYVLTGNGSGVLPTWQTGSSINLGTTEYSIQVGNATGGLTSLPTGSAGQILTSGGASADPDWTTATYPSTINEGDVVIGTGSNQVGVVATSGATSGYVLTANGSGSAPTWEAGSLIDLGTTQYTVQVGNASGGVTSLSTGTAGQVLTSGGPGADPSWQPNGGGPIVINPQTSDYVLELTDAEALVTMDVTSTANTVTIPEYSSVAFPVGTTIWISQLGTGTTQIIPASGSVTINSVASASYLFAQYSLCSLVNLSNDVWLLTGDII